MKGKDLLSKIAYGADLPEDLLLDLPCMRLEGFDRLIVDNHKGVSVFTPTLLKFRTKAGLVTLTGKGFVIEGISSDGIVIKGEIEGVEMRRGL